MGEIERKENHNRTHLQTNSNLPATKAELREDPPPLEIDVEKGRHEVKSQSEGGDAESNPKMGCRKVCPKPAEQCKVNSKVEGNAKSNPTPFNGADLVLMLKDPKDVGRKGEWEEEWWMAAEWWSTCEIEGKREWKHEATHLDTETECNLVNHNPLPSQCPNDDLSHS